MSSLGKIFGSVVKVLGQFAFLIPVIAEKLRVAVVGKDLQTSLKLCDDLDDVADQIKVVTAGLRQRLADGVLDATEGAASLLEMEQLVVEASHLGKRLGD